MSQSVLCIRMPPIPQWNKYLILITKFNYSFSRHHLIKMLNISGFFLVVSLPTVVMHPFIPMPRAARNIINIMVAWIQLGTLNSIILQRFFN